MSELAESSHHTVPLSRSSSVRQRGKDRCLTVNAFEFGSNGVSVLRSEDQVVLEGQAVVELPTSEELRVSA